VSRTYFDDIAVGDRYASAQPILVTAAEIIEFASRYDPQPAHTDPEAAETCFLGGLSASGWHTAALTMRLLSDCGFPIHAGAGSGAELRWLTPTRPGDELSVEVVVTETRLSRSKPDRGVVAIDYVTRNQSGEVRQRAHTAIVVPRDPALVTPQ
jgi:acyl dehydratase